MQIVLIALTGIAAGVIAGMGMGGGTLLIPMLTVFFSVPQHTAQAINLASFIPMSVAAVGIHAKNKLIDYKTVLILIIPACGASVLGALLARTVQGNALQKMFGIFLCVLAALQVVMALIDSKKS